MLTGVDALGNSDSVTITIRLEAEPPAVPPVVIINTSHTATPTATTQTLPHSQITLGGAKFASGVTGGLGPTPTTNSGSVAFGSVETGGEAAPQAEGSPNLLWGLGALGLIGAVTAAVLEERRKRKEEEARQLAEAQAKAAALNAAEEQKRVENYLRGQLVQQGLNTLRNAGGTAEEIARLRDSMSSIGYAATLAAISQRIGEERTRLVGEQLRNIEETEQRYQEQTRTPNPNGADADRNGIQDRYQRIVNEIIELEDQFINQNRNPNPNKIDLDRNGIQDRFQSIVDLIDDLEAQFYGQNNSLDYSSQNNQNIVHGDVVGRLFEFLINGYFASVNMRLVAPIHFNVRPSGNVGVSVIVGESITSSAYRAELARNGFPFSGTYYTQSHVTELIRDGMVEDALGKNGFLVSFATAAISNTIEYGVGSTNTEDFTNRTILNMDYWASLLSDTYFGYIIGGVAAFAIESIVGLPALVSILLAFIVSFGVGYIFNILGINDFIKETLKMIFDPEALYNRPWYWPRD